MSSFQVFIPEEDREILEKAEANIGASCHNIQCLLNFLKVFYPDFAYIEYAVYLVGILRMQEINSQQSLYPLISVPIFGKELDLVDRDRLKMLVITLFESDTVGYIDYTDSLPSSMCVDSNYHLYEIHL